MITVLTNRGLLPYMQSLTYHEEDSLCVQICRILSSLTCQHNDIGSYTRREVKEHWLPILEKWKEEGNTKLHFFASKVLYNCREENLKEQYLNDPIFILYDSGSDNV